MEPESLWWQRPLRTQMVSSPVFRSAPLLVAGEQHGSCSSRKLCSRSHGLGLGGPTCSSSRKLLPFITHSFIIQAGRKSLAGWGKAALPRHSRQSTQTRSTAARAGRPQGRREASEGPFWSPRTRSGAGGAVLVRVLVGSESKPNVAAALFKVQLLSTFRKDGTRTERMLFHVSRVGLGLGLGPTPPHIQTHL